jgi:hypothetical protein
MKKSYVMAIVLVFVFAAASCTGPKGDAGLPGASGTIFMKEFQYAAEPNTEYVNTADAMLSAAFPTYNYGGCYSAIAGNSGSGALRPLFYFDLSAIAPAGVKVNSAYLTLPVAGISGAVTVTAYALETAWYEGTAGCAGAANSDVHWSSFTPAGGKYNASAPVSNSIARDSSAPDCVDPVIFSLNAATVQGWISSPSSNRGIIVTGSNEAVTGFISFNTRENLIGAMYNPKLTVYYTLP